MINLVFAAAIVFAQAAPAAAPPGAVSPAVVSGQKPANAAASADELVCHKEDVVGSLFPKKICARRSEFAKRQEDDVNALDRFRGQSSVRRTQLPK